METLSPVILAIPVYFTLMAIELVIEKFSKHHTYRVDDAITNISTGVLQQLTGTFVKIVKLGVYAFVFEHFAWYVIPVNGWSFALLFVLWDLCYYWEHRVAHRVSLFWGGHSVHHQSEVYNLSVALRQSSTSFLWGFPFYLPLALIGFDPVQVLLAGGFNLLYQFWIHTEHISKLPRLLEWVLNTPSHHRVHHGRDPKYLDKNFAGVFIVWDRLFNTFQAEEERPNYGVTKPLRSWNPVYANVAHYVDLFGYLGKARSLGDGLRILFKPPGWLPDYLGGVSEVPVVADDYQKYEVRLSLPMKGYVLAQFLFALLVNAWYFFNFEGLDMPVQLFFAGWIMLTTLAFGFLFEQQGRKWLFGIEGVRLLALPVGYVVLQIPAAGLLPFLSAFAVLSVVVFLLLQRAISPRKATYSAPSHR